MKPIDEHLLIPAEALEAIAECLRVMAHPVRLRIVELLMQGDFAVNELAALCHTSPNQTCEHLRLMKSHGLLTCRRAGRIVYYQIANSQLPDLLGCIRRHCGICPSPASLPLQPFKEL